MAEFLAALALFLVAHLAPSIPGARPRLVAALGRTGYLVGYSALSLILLAWVVTAARRADTVELWAPAAWQWWLPFLVMPFAAFLLIAGLSEANPLSVSLRRGDDLPAIARVTRHPVLWGFLLWALAHVPANGRLVPVVLFATMAALSVAGFRMLDVKARKRLGKERWRALASSSPLVPFAWSPSGPERRPDQRGLVAPGVASLLLYLFFVLGGHAWLIGPDPLAGLRAFF